MPKPKLVWLPVSKYWSCTGPRQWGFGRTMKEAFDDWLRRGGK